MNYSPLRYPGGKSKIAPLVKLLIEKSHLNNITYIEPFAGGAGVSLHLLFTDTVDHIVINDFDKSIYSVWRAILQETDQFLNMIETTEISITEWQRQKEIYLTQNKKYSVELAFATFYLNRTNRSGILQAGPIGGYDQTGNYLIDARFNKQDLIERIKRIAERKQQITVYNKDARTLLNKYLPRFNNVFMYMDPPYYNKGQQLYKNFFVDKDHEEIANIMRNIDCTWVITYDSVDPILNLYNGLPHKFFDLTYSAAKKRIASEVMFASNKDLWPTPTELKDSQVKIILRED